MISEAERTAALQAAYIEAVKAGEELIHAILRHREGRYGRPAQRPYYDVDRELYRAAGIEP